MRTFPFRLLLLALVVIVGAGQHLSAKSRLAVQPLGPVDGATLEQVAVSLRMTYAFDVDVLQSIPLPEEAYYPPRSRYRAEKILDFVSRTASPQYDKVLAITDRDISTTKGEHADWGIFGLAYLSARPCVVSTCRLKRNATPAQRLVRLLRVARHEVGHMIGLPHCAIPGCVMQDANGAIRGVDAGDGSFCRSCVTLAGPFLLKNDPIGKRP